MNIFSGLLHPPQIPIVKYLNRCIVSPYKHQSLLSVTVTILDKQVFMDLIELSVTEEEGGVKEKKGAPCSAVRGEGRRTRVQGWLAGGESCPPSHIPKL